MPVGERDLVNPPPSLARLQEVSPPALIALLVAGAIAVLDAIVAPSPVLIGLLAIPPVIAAMSSSLPETAVVGALCLALSVLSLLWGEGLESGQRLVSMGVAIGGSLAGLWVASLRARLGREQAASELLA